jgi:hypothetical protein
MADCGPRLDLGHDREKATEPRYSGARTITQLPSGLWHPRVSVEGRQATYGTYLTEDLAAAAGETWRYGSPSWWPGWPCRAQRGLSRRQCWTAASSANQLAAIATGSEITRALTHEPEVT